MERLQEEGLSCSNANALYYDTLKGLEPQPNLLDDYKKVLIKQNLDRLEKIVNDCIGGNAGEKKVALQAIAELNKMAGLYNDGNKVMIAKNADNEEIIQIEFQK